MRNKISNIGFAVFAIFLNINCASNQVISTIKTTNTASFDDLDCRGVCWVGSTSDLGFETAAINLKAKTVEIPAAGQINIQSINGTYSVFNPHLRGWYSTGIQSGNAIFGVTSESKNQLTSIAGDTDPIKVTISLIDSTAKALLFLNNSPLGSVDANGRYWGSPGAVPKYAVLTLLTQKKKCKDEQYDFKVDTENYVFEKTIKLKCN